MSKQQPDLSPVFSAEYNPRALMPINGIGRYIAGPGNHEGQSILVLAMTEMGLSGSTGYELNGLMRELLPELPIGGPTRQKEWCDKSLVPYELMKSERVGSRQEYTLTEDGLEYFALGGALLAFGERYGRSLFDYFGKSHPEGGQNDPQTLRLMTLQYLLGKPQHARSYEDLCSFLEVTSDSATVGRILGTYSLVGLIRYESWNSSKQPSYRPTEKIHDPILSTATSVYGDAVEFFRNSPSETRTLSELTKYLQSKGAMDSILSEKEQRKFVHTLVTTLVRSGRITREVMRESGGALPVTLTDMQRTELESLHRILYGFAAGDSVCIRSGEMQAREFLSSPERLIAAMQRRTSAAGYRVRDPKSDTDAVMMLIAQEGAVTVSSLVGLVARHNTLPRFSYSTIRRILADLTNQGDVTVDNSTGIMHFSPKTDKFSQMPR